ncbi:hypothetical protein BGZ58_007866 [Dissophora ornata]|nr:hypothetical protein BGZ58_007866 [Dissophora ornata]
MASVEPSGSTKTVSSAESAERDAVTESSKNKKTALAKNSASAYLKFFSLEMRQLYEENLAIFCAYEMHIVILRFQPKKVIGFRKTTPQNPSCKDISYLD